MIARNTSHILTMTLVAVLGAGALLTGCQHSGSYDLPHGQIPYPAGTSQSVAFNMQASKGESTKYILYSNRFISNTTYLSPKGQAQVEWMVENIANNPYPVIIEPSGNPRIDEARRAALVDYFSLQGIPDSENFVVVTTPEDAFVPVDSK